MLLYPFFQQRPMGLGELFQDLGRFERQMNSFNQPMASLNNFSGESNEITNNDDKFSINLNVYEFKPEDLKIDLNGRKLTIEGSQEVKNERGYSKRSFSRMVVLPEDVDLSSISSNLTADGHLSIEAPKKEVIKGIRIPIQHSEEPKPSLIQNTEDSDSD